MPRPWVSAVSYTHLDVYKRQEGYGVISLADFLGRRPPCRAVLAVAHRLALDAVKGVALGEEGCDEQKHQQSAAELSLIHI